MSSWQSFFNQLTRPHQMISGSDSRSICQCEGGKLVQNAKMDYIHSGICSPKCFCAIIEKDRQNARKFDQSVSISQLSSLYIDTNEKTGINKLEELLGEK